MKIACQSCGAKYTIADEKVSGKTVKIKCKKCGATVVVDGHAQSDAGASWGNAEAGGDEWTVSVADDDQRTLTTDQIVAEFRNGVVTFDTFVWREGMPEWQALAEVPELAGLCGAPAGAADPPTAAMGSPAGYGMAPVAAAAAPAAAAVRKRGQSVDLFGGGGGGGALEAAPASSAGGSAHIGERNENSVLFSLSALTAAESAAKKGGGAVAPKRAPGAPAAKAASSIDDIMNLGSGGISPGAALAPPPVNAPFIEPPAPPPPPSVSPAMMAGPASGYGPQAAMGMPMGAGPYGGMEQPKKPPVGLIVGGVVGLVVVLGAVFALTRGGGDDKDKLAAADTAKTAEAKPDKKDEPRKEEPAAETAKPDEATPPAGDTAAPATSVAAPTPNGANTGASGTQPPKGGPLPPGGNTSKKEEPKKEEPKKEEPKKEEPAAAGGGTGNFDRGAASASLGSAAASAKGCKKDGGPTGSTKVQVTFAPSGRVTTVNVGAPFAGTPVGSCIAGAFKGASVPPFAGAAQTVSKSVSIK